MELKFLGTGAGYTQRYLFQQPLVFKMGQAKNIFPASKMIGDFFDVFNI
ncbi:ribonuclease Z [Neisseria sp. HMSC067H09]|jgi:hypothetical protein|nr:hypothetical protein HMPREF3156_00906 [Neisseria sp. HMSC06F02]OFS03565.1 ribonuclease Z [Neisseria sp. HMSC067H09]